VRETRQAEKDVVLLNGAEKKPDRKGGLRITL
jgi:hypothetical protein